MDTPDGRLQVAGTTVFLRTGTVLAWTKIVLAALFLLALLSVPLFSLVRAARWILRRGPVGPGLGLPSSLLVACLSVVTAFVLARMAILHQDALTRFGHRTLWSLALTASIWIFATSSFAALLLSVYMWNRRRIMNSLVYYHSLAVALLFVSASVYLFYYGAIGYRSWTRSTASLKSRRALPALIWSPAIGSYAAAPSPPAVGVGAPNLAFSALRSATSLSRSSAASSGCSPRYWHALSRARYGRRPAVV
jgi:hypothetical protein